MINNNESSFKTNISNKFKNGAYVAHTCSKNCKTQKPGDKPKKLKIENKGYNQEYSY
jgi:hypothetical protein